MAGNGIHAARAAEPVNATGGEAADAELLRRVAASHPANHSSRRALEALFQRHSEALLRFLTRLLRNDHTAEDTLHDVFVRVAEAAATYRGESSVRTWLFTLALNKVRSQQRRNALENRASAIMANEPKPESDGRSDPFEQAQERELRRRVDAAIGELGDEERETFLLYWFGQMTYAEISIVSGITVSAAKVRVHRALARLSNRLGKQLGEA
jgi:RNA polymerase sigma-70 factor (ECF subfamily)